MGGGSIEKDVSPNLVRALEYAQTIGTPILGIVGKDGGYTAQVANACVIVPTVNPAHITPHAEAFQAVIWHLLVSHPRLQRHATKWESLKACCALQMPERMPSWRLFGCSAMMPSDSEF